MLTMTAADTAKAEALACAIDKEVNELHSFDLDNKAYLGLVRSLSFNLKRNEVREIIGNRS
jgi:hypothetical protein